MRTVRLNLDGNGNVRSSAGGWVLIVQSLSAGASVDITWHDTDGSQERGKVLDATTGLKFKPGFRFNGFDLSGGTAGAVVELLIGDNPAADADLLDAVTIENPALDPVNVTIVEPVELTASSVTLEANGVEVSDAAPLPVKVLAPDPLPVDQELATVITNNAAVAVTAVITDVLAAGARRAVRLFNQGPDAVAIGGAGLTWATRAVVLEMGDAHEESIAPGAVMKAICDAGDTASLGVQVLA